MTISRIPLNADAPYQTFSVQLSGQLVRFELRWMTLYEFFAVDIYAEGEPVTLGRGLNPGINLLHGLNTELGSIYLEGSQPTVGNLGISNRLLHDSEGGD